MYILAYKCRNKNAVRHICKRYKKQELEQARKDMEKLSGGRYDYGIYTNRWEFVEGKEL